MDFDSFYEENKDSVFRAVVATTGSIGEAEEATAEGFARALTRWSSVSEHPNPAGWVVVTATNYYRSFRRKARRRGALAERAIVAEDQGGTFLWAVGQRPGWIEIVGPEIAHPYEVKP